MRAAPVLRPKAATIGYYVAFIGLGLISASLGPTLPGLAEQTRTDLGEISFLFTTRATGYMLGSLLGGRLYDLLRGHPVMAGSLALMGLGMFMVPTTPILWLLALLLFLVGLGEGAVDVGGNTLIVWIHRSRVGPYMNGLHFFFGLGAFISPLVVAWAIVWSGEIRWAYWLLAAGVIPIVIGLLRLASPQPIAVQDRHAARQPLNWGLAGLSAFFMLLYVGAEVSVAGWLYTYAIELELADVTSAAYLTSVFWGALMIGRLLSIPIAARFRPRSILMVDLIGCLASIGLILALPSQGWALWVGTFGVGLAMASIFPTVITWGERRMTLSGQVTSLFLVGASLGAMFLPWLIGQLFVSLGPSSTMIVILADLVLATILLGVLMVYGGAPRDGAEE